MEIGAFFLLVIVIVIGAGLGGGVYAIAMWLRGKELAPERNKLEPEPDEEGPPPEHREVESEQRTRFVGTN